MNPLRKALQRAFLNLLSSRRGTIILFIALVFTVNTVIEFLHVFFAWGPLCGAACAVRGYNNIGEREVKNEICSMEVDVVYTWVNGSDPRLVKELLKAKIAADILSPPANCTRAKSDGIRVPGRYHAVENISTPAPSIELDCEDTESQKATTNRYRDNQELKYSLRSLEKNAPWIRHIYLVTNGQIPSWLDLNNPKLTVVPHSEIFLNKSHLPTFSSPSIETHLHRIPGLSKKFLYFNDDVFLGNKVTVDDFYTEAHGQKVFLAWGVPNCNEGCTSTWIGDGYCDLACNVTACEFDAGDCKNGTTSSRYESSSWYYGSNTYSSYQYSTTKYCSPQCPTSWIGDRFCDRFCKSKECGYDAGDCGIEDVVENVFGYNITWDRNLYDVPFGEPAAYFFLHTLFDGDIEEGSHDNTEIVRTATISQKHKIMVMTFYTNVTRQNIFVEISGYHNSTLKKAQFNVTVETSIRLKNDSNDDIHENMGYNNETLPTTKPQIVNTTLLDFINDFTNMTVAQLTSNTTQNSSPGLVQISNQGNTTLSSNTTSIIKQILETSSNSSIIQNQAQNSSHASAPLDISHNKTLNNQTTTTALYNTTANIPATNTSHVTASKTSQQDKETPQLEEVGQFTRKLLWLDATSIEYQAPEYFSGKDRVHVVRDARASEEHISNWSQLFGRIGYCLFFDDSDIKELNEMDGDNQGHLAFEASWICDQKEKQILKDKVPAYRLKWNTAAMMKRTGYMSRSLKDLFGESLIFVNRLLNRKFKVASRRVPAHMPHMIDKEVMQELQDLFPVEWNQTSANRFRSANDMQYAFSYFYYMMSRSRDVDLHDIFQSEIDTNNDNFINENELRTIATRLKNDVEDDYLDHLRAVIRNGSSHGLLDYEGFSNAVLNKTIDIASIAAGFAYKYEIVGTDDVDFLMVGDNITRVLPQLDGVRRRKLKFVCINDNMKGDEPNIPVLDAIHDLYESFFPIPSSFELSSGVENRHLHVDDYYRALKQEEKSHRFYIVKVAITIAFVIVIIAALNPIQYAKAQYASWKKKNREKRHKKLLDV
eukprot:TRINITY_DN10607_c0_g1_i1.p1 TRINITY_DN10607_c0_g1~~TRINITY_DN10607_c0_g1_i1.p1  ORF type:complete len:1048 (+),score=167.37 TRINITY_DN10607_c0_g1_i1:41-3184(+)